MEYVKLKNTDLTVSRFCMGGCPMGGYDWGTTTEEHFLDAIHTGLEMGVNFFDTADTYGLGQSERTLAKGLGKHRGEVIIQTKFGVRAGQGKTVIDNSPGYLREALENSLRRLGTDWIDIYVVHYWDRKTPPMEIVDELERQRQAGKIRYFGLSNIREDAIRLCAPFRGLFTTAQHEFSLGCRDRENEIGAVRKAMDTTPLTWGSLGQGIFTGKYDEHTVFGNDDRRRKPAYVNFHGEKLKHNLEIVDALRAIGASYRKSCAAVALRFIMDYLGDAVPIVGVKDAGQMKDNLDSLDWKLSREELDMLNEISLGSMERAALAL